MSEAHQTMREENISQAVTSAPPAVVAGLTMAGVSLQDWVLVATLAWLGMQMMWFGFSRYKEWRDKP